MGKSAEYFGIRRIFSYIEETAHAFAGARTEFGHNKAPAKAGACALQLNGFSGFDAFVNRVHCLNCFLVPS